MSVRIRGAGSAGVTGSGTINNLPLWVNTTQLGDSVLRQVGTAIIVGATDPAAAATETFRTLGGIISDTGAGHDSVKIGRGAASVAALNARNVVIGTIATSSGAGAVGNVVIGYNAAAANQGGSVVIGENIPWVNTAGPAVVIAPDAASISFPGVAIGAGLTCGGSGVLVGNQASSAAVNNYVGVGRLAKVNAQYQITVGDNANNQAGHTASILIGANTVSLGANYLIIGALNIPIATVLIGEGDTKAAYAGITYRHTNGSGVDDPGGNVTYAASRGTGAAATQGKLIFQTGTPGAAGAALQALATRLEILPAQNAAGAAVNFVGTNSPGAAAGTLANAPTAGNPEWVPVLFNGNVRYLPVWP